MNRAACTLHARILRALRRSPACTVDIARRFGVSRATAYTTLSRLLHAGVVVRTYMRRAGSGPDAARWGLRSQANRGRAG